MPKIVFSLEHPNKRLSKRAMASIQDQLQKAGIQFVVGIGRYRYNSGTSIQEISIFCEVKGIEALFVLKRLVKKYDQESYLIIDENKDAFLVFTKIDEVKKLGKWRRISKSVTKDAAAFSEFNGRYFMAS